ncbi:MAG: hypothetical protein WC004_01275 [Candidatus Absconditabacterales bacterium]
MQTSSKAFGLGIIFFISLIVFLGTFFGIGGAYWLITGFVLFLSLLLWSLTSGPGRVRTHYKKWIIAIIICIAMIVGIARNRYRSLSFFILAGGIIYTFWDTIHHQHQILRFKARGYCIYGAFNMVYFLGFAVGAQIIADNYTLSLDCQDIYSHYQQATSWIKKPEKRATSTELSRSDKIRRTANKIGDEHPTLHSLLGKIKGYQEEIQGSIKDQQEINQEICGLVTNRIHDIYTNSNIKVGLIILIGLFLYPFFIILFYFYGFLAYLIIGAAIQHKLFRRTTITVEKTVLE